MSGKKGRSGRKKLPSREINEYLENDKNNIPAYLAEMSSQALRTISIDHRCPNCGDKHTIEVKGGGNYQALAWLLERHYGKAPASLIVKGPRIVLTGDNYQEVARQIMAAEVLALTEGVTGEQEDSQQ